MDLTPIPRVRWTDFHPSRFGGTPRVVVDNESHWAAVRQWDAEYLKSVVGDREVAVRETAGPPRNLFQNLAEGGQIPFRDYLDWVLSTADEVRPIAQRHSDVSDFSRAIGEFGFEASYYLDVKLERLSAALFGEARPPGWYSSPPIDTNFWCGVLGTSSGLHCDVTPNCNVQVIGQKHFILFPPSQSRAVYQVPGITHCRFDPNLPDFDRFPLARHAVGWQCRLAPGEALYIPVGWFHQVTVASDWAVNVNFFWRRPFPQGLLTPNVWRFLLRRQRVRISSVLGRTSPRQPAPV
jgi:hypothetical protein